MSKWLNLASTFSHCRSYWFRFVVEPWQDGVWGQAEARRLPLRVLGHLDRGQRESVASRDTTDRFVQRPPPNAAPQRHSRGVRLADQDEPHVIRHAERYKHLKCRYFTLSLKIHINEKYPRPIASKLLQNESSQTQNLYAILIPHCQGLFFVAGLFHSFILLWDMVVFLLFR